MTIKPGASWGRQVPRPDGLVAVDSDAAFVEALISGEAPAIAVRSGDLARTLGSAPNGSRTMVNEYSIDLLRVRLDDSPDSIWGCAHVVARSPLARGHWLRGPILAVMNAEFIDEWDIAPRGHPNDGRAEVFHLDASMSVRHRLAARKRLTNATHVPHPQIRTRSIRADVWHFDRPLEISVDGRRVGRTSTLEIDVIPDAATVYA